MASSSTSQSLTSSAMDAPVDFSKVYEFWLKPENYCDVPVTMAFELFKANRIDVTRFCHHVRECREVPDNLEEMCEYAVRNSIFPTVTRTDRWINWYHYLEENVLSQTSQEFVEQWKNHEKNLKQYKQLLLEMDMRCGGTREITLFFDAQKKLMIVDPVKALAMQPPIEWTTYIEYSAADRELYRKTFIFEMSKFHVKQTEERSRFLAAITADREIRSVISRRNSHQNSNQKRKQIRAAKQSQKKAEDPEKKAATFKKIKELGAACQMTHERLMEILNSEVPQSQKKAENQRRKAYPIRRGQGLGAASQMTRERLMEILNSEAPQGPSK
ncbi:hypothetical protein CAEBREN_06769 [Caenorhabditis brenneri]|uniref:Uncharacterized protein n=1 Tax=Caenorhabditis brenneri TaxID=135651 RepID=G0NRF2_CAEBE|nr:hypothetical protein CAEBREN_06769 [Caenorhabditis brenneri]